jgi:ATP-dependent DNA helicase RecG
MYAGRLEKLNIHTFQDLLFHIPSRYVDYSVISEIARVQPGETVTVHGLVLSIENRYVRGSRFKTLQKATITDDTGIIALSWFNQPFLLQSVHEGDKLSVSGKAEKFLSALTIQSPQFEVLYTDETKTIHTGRLVPIYPETRGVSSKWLRRQIFTLLAEMGGEIEEYLPDALLKKDSFLLLQDALQEVHFPDSYDQAAKARSRLGFDELFLLQLSGLARRKEWQEKQQGFSFTDKPYEAKIVEFVHSLPFVLTESQKNAVTDIFTDLTSSKPMNRMLQGDVGSGKTVVGTMSAYLAFLNGYQTAFMAPTEILAEQHFQTIQNLLSPYGVNVSLQTGSKKTKKLEMFDILVGTHALIAKKVNFSNLGLVIIDEQQRFGVEQRGVLREKGQSPHILTMTATPIPRTVALTLYGDLDVSYLHDMPKGRKIIKTWLTPKPKRGAAYDWIRRQITETGSQAFIICPFIEESENMTTVKAAAKEYEHLSKTVFAKKAGQKHIKLGLLHGKMKAREKDAVLDDFRQKKFDILVATPVVEVGIDIPNATIIMIEAADRFGLAQLHQLRGRVGRSDQQSYCLLFTESENPQTKTRLKAMEQSHSGAELAELDLKLRGPGDMYGTAQHGVPKLKVASFSDFTLIEKAKIEAESIFPKLAEYSKLQEKIATLTDQTISPD